MIVVINVHDVKNKDETMIDKVVELLRFNWVIILMILTVMGYVSSIFYFSVFLSCMSVVSLTVPLILACPAGS